MVIAIVEAIESLRCIAACPLLRAHGDGFLSGLQKLA
jgi:hypothetical protein